MVRLTPDQIMKHRPLKDVVEYFQKENRYVKPSEIMKTIPEYRDYRMLRRHLRILEREGMITRKGDRKPEYKITDDGVIESFYSLYPYASIETKVKIAREWLDYIIPETCIYVKEGG